MLKKIGLERTGNSIESIEVDMLNSCMELFGIPIKLHFSEVEQK